MQTIIGEKINGKLEIKVEGNIDTVTSSTFEKNVKEALDGVTNLILNFEQVKYISSAGLRAIISINNILENVDGEMTIKNVCEDVDDVFEITGLNKMLNIEWEMEALNSHIYSNKLTVPAKIPEFDNIREFISNFLLTHNIEGKSETQIIIASDEIFTNIVNYAYEDSKIDSAIVEVNIAYDDKEKKVILNFIDSGVNYNPLEYEATDVDQRIKERKIGGLGLLMVKKMMTSVDYKRDGDKNILSLVKIISW